MCGRYTLVTPEGEVLEQFNIHEPPRLFPPRYNIAPTQMVPAVRQAAAGRELVLLRWGLVPSWAKNTAGGFSMFNARAETVDTKPAYRSAFRRHRPCLPQWIFESCWWGGSLHQMSLR